MLGQHLQSFPTTQRSKQSLPRNQCVSKLTCQGKQEWSVLPETNYFIINLDFQQTVAPLEHATCDPSLATYDAVLIQMLPENSVLKVASSESCWADAAFASHPANGTIPIDVSTNNTLCCSYQCHHYRLERTRDLSRAFHSIPATMFCYKTLQLILNLF